jgi:hypothetical protein
MRFVAVLSIVFAVVSGGCTADPGPSLPGNGAALSGSLCELRATGTLIRGETFSFDTSAATVNFDGTLSGGGSHVLTASGMRAECVRQPGAFVAELRGAATWNGAPGHQFVLHATHVPASIATRVAPSIPSS